MVKAGTEPEGTSRVLGSPRQEVHPFDTSFLDHKTPRGEDHSLDFWPQDIQLLEEQFRIQIIEVQSQLEQEKERHRARTLELEQEKERHRARILELEQKLDDLTLIIGLGAPSHGNKQEEELLEVENAHCDPAKTDSSSSPGAATLVEPSDEFDNPMAIDTKKTGDQPNTSMKSSSHMHADFNEMMDSSPQGYQHEVVGGSMNSNSSLMLSKRKRLSSVRFSDFLSLKKQRVAELMMHDNDDVSSQDLTQSSKVTNSSPIHEKSNTLPVVLSLSGIHQILRRPAQSLTSLSSSTKKLRADQSKILAGKDYGPPGMPEANQASGRPVSWPRSRRWRKSFGVSVKALRDGFEKMTIEKVEPVHALPLSI